jgi:predicted RecA/RadA family phage recombinase
VENYQHGTHTFKNIFAKNVITERMNKMQQTIKYGTDEYGNVWHDFAQIEPVGGTVCYNPVRETLDEPPAVAEGKRLIVENGKWLQIAIGIENTAETTDNGIFYRPKTSLERMRDGIDEIPKGQKLETGTDGELTLIAKTLEEQLKTNEITQGQYNEIKNQPVIQALQEIDIKKVRSISEWILKQADCPEFLKQYEEQATKKRSELLK